MFPTLSFCRMPQNVWMCFVYKCRLNADMFKCLLCTRHMSCEISKHVTWSWGCSSGCCSCSWRLLMTHQSCYEKKKTAFVCLKTLYWSSLIFCAVSLHCTYFPSVTIINKRWQVCPADPHHALKFYFVHYGTLVPWESASHIGSWSCQFIPVLIFGIFVLLLNRM